MPPIPSVWQWHSLVARHAQGIREALHKVGRALDAHLSTGQPQAKLETILVRNTPKQPLHPLARIRQSQSRWYSTARRYIDGARNFSSASTTRGGHAYDRATFATFKVGSRISQSSGRAPFASTLRPNLTGGTLGRTAGGYTIGSGRVGGARYFSHGPASQAQVVQNVSQAVRAFFISGHKAQFDGVSPTGQKKYKAVSSLQEETGRKMRSLPRATPGSRLEFVVNPTITALTQLNSITGYDLSEHAQADHLNTDGLLDVLSIDFSRALKDLAAVFNDLKRLSALGDLPITYEGSSLRVHFPGCDAETVERLCDELNVLRGNVVEDEAFDSFVGTDIALLFPFAPSQDVSDCESLFDEVLPRKAIDYQDMFIPSSPAYSTQSDTGMEDVEDVLLVDNPWLSSPSGYESARSSSEYGSNKHDPLEYQGFDGIYKFIEELDAVRK
ncbi:hypothetical protein BDY17DRAFT_292403 [Neohortaea acidophila]|uniref:Casein kinase II beta 2 subunit n=1 Tax=Neohortaea acidophila TaxID=245834 RepID=A0A6A6Q3U6_9PEZI|nr:uncharacterized protein BDY17DRAFT_292403 [Neohortaea acidophila]KAF2486952.1 hypothetical protein BDY17DRAFT_292403 [Neohortaea acidophila]